MSDLLKLVILIFIAAVSAVAAFFVARKAFYVVQKKKGANAAMVVSILSFCLVFALVGFTILVVYISNLELER